MAIKAVKSKGKTTLVDTKKKKLAGSIGKGKKATVPTASKKAVTKPVAKKVASKEVAKPTKKIVVKPVAKKTVAKPVVKKASTTPVKTVVVKKVAPPVVKPAAKKVVDPLSEPWVDEELEIDFAFIEAGITDSVFVENFTPTTKGFVSSFRVRVKEHMETHDGISWIADIYRLGRKVGTAENKGDGGANYYYFDRREDRSDWEDEAEVAYANSMNEGDEDTLFMYLDSLSDNPKLSDN